MKKYLVILAVLLIFSPLGFAEEPDQTPAETSSILKAADEPAATAQAENLEAKTPESAPVASETNKPEEEAEAKKNNLELAAKLQIVQNRLDTDQLKIQRLQRQVSQTQYFVLILALLVALLILLMAKRRKSIRKEAAVPLAAGTEKTIVIEDDTRGEYDFMGSSEGIPAKLDLARAYIAMEDFNAARQTLSDILGEGDEAQRLEAKTLLKKIDPQ